MRRPLDGFWDLIHEKRGSIAAANTIVAVSLIVHFMWLMMMSFQNINFNLENFNTWIEIGAFLMPILLFVVANWCLTTLFNGKGRMRDIYMGYAYAMAPQTILRVIMIPLSHMLTWQEGTVIGLIFNFSNIWFYFLVLCAMKQIHDYSFGKAVVTSLLSLVAIGIMIFIFVMFFAVVSDGIVYFWSIGQEALFRIRRG
jgi:uncharacterized membrane protein YhdT